MTESEVIEKFRGNAKLVIAKTKPSQVIAKIMDLENIANTKSLVELMIPR